MTRGNKGRRGIALLLAGWMTAACWVPASAASIGDGVTPSYDEAYYATLDYYGNLMEGSVVKSYALNGASSFTDYGTYDEVVNLTDSTQAVSSGDSTAFQFDQAPGHFYFEGKTAQPFRDLPWTITLRYTLNGVPVKAEELAGKTGVVEILLDLVPNESASSYARYNYTLEAMALFNEDDILSLEAEGAQVQLVGNLRTVLFMCLPGEEQHFTIRVGSNDFSFGGMTVLMVPATLAQLEEIAKLSQRKDELEEDYRALSGSLDALLDALNDIQSGLYASADGLDQLDIARGTISGGKGLIYDEAGVLRGDLTAIAGLLEPVEQRALALSQTVTGTKAVLNEMADTALALRGQLEELEKALSALESGTGDVKDLLESAADLEDSLERLERALGGTGISGGGSSSSMTATVDQVKQVHGVYEAAQGDQRQAAYTGLLVLQGESKESAAEKAQKASQLVEAGALANAEAKEQVILALTFQAVSAKVPSLTQEQFAALLAAGDPAVTAARETVAREVEAQLPDVKKLEALYQAGHTQTFQQFCEKLPGISKSEAKQMNDLWLIYSSGREAEGASLEEEESQTAPETPVVRPAGGAPAGVMSGALAGSMLIGAAAEALPAADQAAPDQEAPEQPAGDEAPVSQEEDPSVPQEESPAPQEEEPPASREGEDAGTPDENDSVGGAAIDLIAGGLDSANNKISQIQRELSDALDDITGPTAQVVGELSDLCRKIDDLTDMADDAADLSAALRRSSKELRAILDSTDRLRTLLNGYEPTLQESLANVGAMSTAAAGTVRDLERLLSDVESLMKSSGSQLDAGTKATLRGLSDALRQTARAMAATGDVRDAKTTITDIIEDTWDEYTGDINNILLMDAGAEAVSLTDSRNPAPNSVQVLIRTQEIKVEDSDAEEETAAAKEKTTFWQRVAQMFRDFWNAITGIFH